MWYFTYLLPLHYVFYVKYHCVIHVTSANVVGFINFREMNIFVQCL
jgi:hypothetical protein